MAFVLSLKEANGRSPEPQRGERAQRALEP